MRKAISVIFLAILVPVAVQGQENSDFPYFVSVKANKCERPGKDSRMMSLDRLMGTMLCQKNIFSISDQGYVAQIKCSPSSLLAPPLDPNRPSMFHYTQTKLGCQMVLLKINSALNGDQ